jgi:mono/diheme cytochrome c family protein
MHLLTTMIDGAQLPRVMVLRGISLAALLAVTWSGLPAAAEVPASVAAIVESKCTGCHGGDNPESGVKLDGEWSAERLVSADGNTWFRALHEIESGRMPPEEEEQPTAADRATMATWIRGDLAALQKQHQVEVGRSQFRRLSREEYANTVFDIFGFRPPVTVDLPEDGRVDGYQKVAKALPLSAASVDGYLRLADRIMGRLLKPLPAEPPPFKRYNAKRSSASAGHSLELDEQTHVSFNSDPTSGNFESVSCNTPGLHKVRLSVFGYQTDKPLPFGIYGGHVSAYPQLIELLAVLDAPPGEPSVLETVIYLASSDMNDKARVGDSLRVIPFGLGVPVPKGHQAKAAADKGLPGLAVQWIELQPLNVPASGDTWLTADFPAEFDKELRQIRGRRLHGNPARPVAKLTSVKPDEFLAIIDKTIRRVTPRFFRRDLSEEEVAAVMTSIRCDIDADRCASDIVLDQFRNLLTSPDFFCIVEEPGPLSGFALATRLSYFLWNSAPDEQLLALARQKKLSDSVVLREQTDRMLADPKARRFYKDFAAQWLRLAAIDDTTPDQKLFPEYHLPENDLLKWSSVAETEAFLKLLVDENASVKEIVDSRRVLANAVLARHYGIPGVDGAALRELKLPAGSAFGGIWTQPSVTKVTANGTNTSPVKRGVFVAERLLGVHIPPPPPNIEPIATDTSAATSLKERLALHAGNGSCAACHAKFDGYGFALESFDPAGMFREFYRTTTADTVTWKGPADGTWGGQAGAVSADWTGGNVPAALDPVAIVGRENGTLVYDKPLYGDAAHALHGLAIGNAVSGAVTRLVTEADLLFHKINRHEFKQVLVGSGGHWLHRDGNVAINDNVLIDGGELGVAGGTFKAGMWPAWTPLEISRGGRIVVNGGEFSVAGSNTPQLIGNNGTGSFAASGSSKVAIGGSVRIGNAADGRGEVVLDTSEPIMSVRQWDVQHGRLTIGENSARIFCNTGAPKQGNFRIGMDKTPALLEKLGAADFGGDPNPDGKIFMEVGPSGTVNWHGGNMLTNKQNDASVITNAGVFNYLDDTGGNVFHFGGPVFVNAEGGRFHWHGSAGLDLRNSRTEGSSSLQNAGLLATGHDGQVILLGDLALEQSGTLRVGLGVEDKTGILVGGKEGGAITLDGRLEIAPLADAETKLGGRTFTILARAPGGPAITGRFASTSDDIAKVDYTEDAVTITLVENPKAKPIREPEPQQPVTFAEAPRLDATGLVALQKRKAGWVKDRPTWRNHLPIESNGTMPSGEEFAGITELRERLAAAPAQLAYGVGNHLVTYATGMRPLGVDSIAIEAVAAETKPDAFGFRSLLHAVIQSDLFRNK